MRFTRKITPYVVEQLENAKAARAAGNHAQEFLHLENAHVLGQRSTYWHTRTHVHMLMWAIRQHSAKEFAGQVFRIVGAFTKTAIGLVPTGNTGGSNISPFRSLPLEPEHKKILDRVNPS